MLDFTAQTVYKWTHPLPLPVLQLLRKSILQMGKPMLEAQESPPFEKPSIEQVITCASAAKQKQH